VFLDTKIIVLVHGAWGNRQKTHDGGVDRGGPRLGGWFNPETKVGPGGEVGATANSFSMVFGVLPKIRTVNLGNFTSGPANTPFGNHNPPRPNKKNHRHGFKVDS